jgi:acetyl esterase/lipase/protocatechuate 3,4-dioxygenase beta subunit
MSIALAVAACGGDGGQAGPVPPRQPSVIEVVSGNEQAGQVGEVLAQSVSIKVSDESGDPVAGVTVSFSADADDGGFEPATAETDHDGLVGTRWTLGSHAGQQTATVTVSGLSPLELTATAMSPPATNMVPVAGDDQEADVGSDVPSAPMVEVHDDGGHPVAGIAVNFAASGDGSVSPATVITGDDGRAAPDRWTLGTTAGPDTLLAASPAISGATLTFVAHALAGPASASASSISVSPDHPVVGQTTNIRVVVRDKFGNPVSDAVVEADASGSGHAIGQPAQHTDPDGRAEATLVSSQAGPVALSARANGVTLEQTVALTVAFGPGKLDGRSYCTIGGVASVMDVFVPDASHPRPLPVAVHVHGGGYTSGARSTGFYFDDIEPVLLDRGYLVVSLDYRLAPAHKYPAQIQDLKCAIRHLRGNADLYGLDTERIGVWGSSAGAQLVGLLGTTGAHSVFDDVGPFQDESSEVQAVIAMSAITDFTRTSELNDNYSAEFPSWPDPSSPELIEASPTSHVTPDDSPFLFIAGEDDDLVLPAQSQHMNSLLHDQGVASEVLLVSHADHGLLPTDAPISPGVSAIVNRMADFFDAHLR